MFKPHSKPGYNKHRAHAQKKTRHNTKQTTIKTL